MPRTSHVYTMLGSFAKTPNGLWWAKDFPASPSLYSLCLTSPCSPCTLSFVTSSGQAELEGQEGRARKLSVSWLRPEKQLQVWCMPPVDIGAGNPQVSFPKGGEARVRAGEGSLGSRGSLRCGPQPAPLGQLTGRALESPAEPLAMLHAAGLTHRLPCLCSFLASSQVSPWHSSGYGASAGRVMSPELLY